MSLRTKLAQNPLASRGLAFGLMLVVLGVLAFGISYLLRDMHRKFDETIESRVNLLNGYRRVAANRPVMEAAIHSVRNLDTAQYYLKNSSPSLAAAEIQSAAQAAFDLNNIKVQSVNIVPHKDVEGRRKITVRFNLRGTLEATQKTLYALETTLPYFFIDGLSIRSGVNNSMRWKPTPNLEPEVQVQFDLYGFAQIGKKK